MMIQLSSTIYDFLLEHSKNFQNALQTTDDSSSSLATEPDTDDVYYCCDL